jgi:hypothetical protein
MRWLRACKGWKRECSYVSRSIRVSSSWTSHFARSVPVVAASECARANASWEPSCASLPGAARAGEHGGERACLRERRRRAARPTQPAISRGGEMQRPTFEQIVREYLQFIRCALWRLGARGSDLDELVQEVLLAVHRGLPVFDPERAACPQGAVRAARPPGEPPRRARARAARRPRVPCAGRHPHVRRGPRPAHPRQHRLEPPAPGPRGHPDQMASPPPKKGRLTTPEARAPSPAGASPRPAPRRTPRPRQGRRHDLAAGRQFLRAPPDGIPPSREGAARGRCGLSAHPARHGGCTLPARPAVSREPGTSASATASSWPPLQEE